MWYLERNGLLVTRLSTSLICLLLVLIVGSTARPQQVSSTAPAESSAASVKSSTIPATSNTASAKTDPPIARRMTLKGVPNYAQVAARLYRGGQPTQEGFTGLAHEGVGVVVDLRGDRKYERDIVQKLGMQYVAIPWHCYNPQDKQMAEFLKVIRDNGDKKVFVHCRLGEDRTGMMVAAYRMSEEGWSAGQAGKEMAAFGFSPMHHMICPSLASYEANFPTKFPKSSAFQTLHPTPAAPAQPQH